MPTTKRAPALLSPAAARAIFGGISTSTQRRLVQSGDYPQPIVLSVTRSKKPARLAFVEAEIHAWCARRIEAARRQPKNQEATTSTAVEA